jgi:hypothetical protein
MFFPKELREFYDLIWSRIVFFCLSSSLTSGGATATVLMKIINEIQLGVEAFDFISYDLLLRKLKALFRLSNVACMFIGLFLDSRSQRVRLNGDYSEFVVLTSGCLQGSVFSPLLCEELQCSSLRG